MTRGRPPLSTRQHPCPNGDGCALNKGAIHCYRCRRNWPRDWTWEVPLDQRPVRQRDVLAALGRATS